MDKWDLRKHTAAVIDTTWKYSQYWGQDDEWVSNALKDCDLQIAASENRALRLRYVRSLLMAEQRKVENAHLQDNT